MECCLNKVKNMLPVTCQKRGLVGQQNVLFLLSFNFCLAFDRREKVNHELKCPSINQLKREKTKY